MYKIKNSYIDKMIDKQTTSAETNFILYIAQFQDMSGKVESVYYKDVCSAIHISYQWFYDILRSLQEKGLITYKKVHRSDIQVQLIGNDFRTKTYQKGTSGYLKVAAIDFEDENFQDMKAGSKLLYLFMQRFKSGKHESVRKFYDDFSKQFHVAEKSLQKYLKELKENRFLYITKKRNKAYNYEICMKISYELHIDEHDIPNEKATYRDNLKDLIRRNFTRYVPVQKEEGNKVLDDIVNLTTAKRAEKHKDFVGMIMEAISRSISQQKEENKEHPILNAALVNTCITSLIEEKQRERLLMA